MFRFCQDCVYGRKGSLELSMFLIRTLGLHHSFLLMYSLLKTVKHFPHSYLSSHVFPFWLILTTINVINILPDTQQKKKVNSSPFSFLTHSFTKAFPTSQNFHSHFPYSSLGFAQFFFTYLWASHYNQPTKLL